MHHLPPRHLKGSNENLRVLGQRRPPKVLTEEVEGSGESQMAGESRIMTSERMDSGTNSLLGGASMGLGVEGPESGSEGSAENWRDRASGVLDSK